MKFTLYTGALTLLALLAGCGEGSMLVGSPKDDELDAARQREAWSAADNPALFNQQLEFKFDALPLTGEASVIPWAGNYWPVYEDSINKQWSGEGVDSPAAKYEKAFGVTGVEDKVSRYHGIDSFTSQKECAETSECNSELGEVCAKRRGKTSGRCIPTWWGICHAWAPASILMPEPKRPVVRNNVEFKVQDIKALVTLVYNKTQTKFVSLRCNQNLAQGDIAFDNYGRPSDGDKECRDTNPGTWHILLTNYLGIMRQSFVEDRTIDYEVWNQPLRGYRITEKRTVTAAEANALIGATTVGGTTVTKSGTVAKDAWAHQGSFDVPANGAVRVLMTGSGDADLYVKLGAEPTLSAYDCRPYAGGSAEECELTAGAEATKVFVSVHGYADTSDFSLNITVGGEKPTDYVFNANARQFVYVKSEVDYIAESAAGTDGNLAGSIDRYTHTDHYEYILELDADGKIIGGEWVGESKKAHPDFVWLPLSHSGSSVAGGAITYANVKALLDESIAEQGGTGQDRTVTEAGSVARNEFKVYGPFNVASGSTLSAVMTGTGDADLYVRKGAAPSMTQYDCRPYKGGSAESCSLAGPGQIWVAVNGYATQSDFSVVITFKEPAGSEPPPPPPPSTIAHLDTSGSVAQGEMRVFTLDVPAGQKLRISTTAPSDVDLYVHMDVAPTTGTYLKRAYTASGDEVIEFVPASSGKLHVGVHGYQASSFTVKTESL